ncbi:hypothetical protein HanIR_Chr17g0888651 [Helianthus annuus]|nr:hypothetical protein HanIR_Chr17g0888651 [Helianthus annuus]
MPSIIVFFFQKYLSRHHYVCIKPGKTIGLGYELPSSIHSSTHKWNLKMNSYTYH